MGMPVSLLLIAVGLVLALAVHQTGSPPVDVNTVGWILFVVGLGGLLLSLVLWESWGPGYGGWHRGAYAHPGGGYRRSGWGYRGRRTVVEEEGAAPMDPYDAPPPP
jgi:hypothetical protein